MHGGIGRRSFFKRVFAASALSAGSLVSRKSMFAEGSAGSIASPKTTGIFAMDNPNYDIVKAENRIVIEYYGLSCFKITSSKGKTIITDPFISGPVVLHNEVKKDPADVVTVSCGTYSHCHVFSVGGTPYLYQIAEPTVLHGITFRGVVTKHLTMKEISTIYPADNMVICFEVDGIKICHLGALGHVLTDEQVKQIGKVDILMVPVGGVSTLPVEDARKVCKQINPQMILPMNYRSERFNVEGWATVEDFFSDRNPRKVEENGGHTYDHYDNVLRCNSEIGSESLEFMMVNGRLELTSPADNSQISAPTMNAVFQRFVY